MQGPLQGPQVASTLDLESSLAFVCLFLWCLKRAVPLRSKPSQLRQGSGSLAPSLCSDPRLNLRGGGAERAPISLEREDVPEVDLKGERTKLFVMERPSTFA